MKGADSGKIKGGRAKKNVKGTKPKREKKGRKTKKGFVKSEKAYEMLFEQSSDGIIIISGGKIARANQAFCEGYGLPIEKVIGKNPLDMMHHDDRKTAAQRMKSMLAGKVVTESHVYRGLREDGSIVWGDVRSRIIEWEGKPAIQSVIRDITERKRAEEALQEQEQQYRSIFESVTDGILIFDKEGRVVEANPAACTMHGYTREEMIGLTGPDFVHPDFHGRFAEFCKTTPGEIFIEEPLDIRKDGSLLPLQVRGSTFKFRGKSHVLAVITDITERKRTENALRESEEKFKGIFDFASDALHLMEGSKFIANNEKAIEMYGYKNKEEMLGATPMDISPDRQPDGQLSSEKAIKYIDEALTGKPQRFCWQHKRRDTGALFDVEVSLSRIFLGDKRYLLASGRDVAERKKAEEALRESEERFRAIAEHSRIGITIVQDLKLAYVNPHVSEITGYSRDELLGMPSASVIHKGSHPEADEKMAELLAGAPSINTELRVDTKSGEERWVDISTILVDFQNKSTFISTVVDITERKRYRVKLAAIYEFSRMMSSTFNINEIVTLVLEASEKILRYGNCAIELVDKEKQELFTVARRGFPEDIPFLRLPLNSEKGLVIACIHEGKTIYVSDTRKDERYYEEIESTLSNLCVPLKVGGEVIGVFDIESPHLNGFIEEDISLAQMLASSAAIAIENARLYEQTKQSKFQLEFVTDLMSHDLSNINQIALGSIGILSESELSEYQKKLVTSAKNAVRRSTGLVSNFKTLQRISKQAEEKKKTELSSIIGDAIKKMSDYPGKIVKIEYAPREGQLVYADDNLSRALENLFDNAIKFTLQEKMRIDVEVFEEGDTFNVRVKDWGTGVSDLMKEEIFKRFEKLGEGRLGTGLGLYVSKKIVEDHGGKIWVHDNPEGGSVFVVQIPRFPTMLK